MNGGLPPSRTAASGELNDLVAKVKAKLQENKRTEADLAPELREFEALLAKHKGEKTDDVAQILLMEAMLYLQVLDNNEKGTELIKQLQRDFPGTKPAENADKTLASMKKQAEAKKIKAALAEGTKFPDFEVKDTTGKPLSIANYKGKVVLLDFWATWCGPCVHELPNVIKTYEAHHPKGFEIIGISLDKDQDKLASFTKEKNMTWVQRLRRPCLGEQAGGEIRHQQHSGHVPPRRPGNHHRQGPAWRSPGGGGRQGAGQAVEPATPAHIPQARRDDLRPG